jgi:hypothetical protein
MNTKQGALAAMVVTNMVLLPFTATAAEAVGLTKQQLENTVYIMPSLGELPDEKSEIKKGYYKKDETTIGVMHTAGGALGQPPKSAGAVVFYMNTGGSGDFMFVEAFLQENGKAKSIAYRSLGDRSVVNKLTIVNGQIVIDMIAHGPNDGAVNPSVHRIVRYKLVKDKLTGPDVN